MRSLAGVLFDKGRDRFVVVEDDKIVEVVRVRGKRVYLHKCERTSERGGGIIAPEKSARDHSIFVVLAVGDEVTLEGIEPNVQVSIPEHGLYVRSPYHPDEYWVPEEYLQVMIGKDTP